MESCTVEGLGAGSTEMELNEIGSEVQYTLREESSQTNVILQYKLLAAILRSVCSVIQ